jgi:hypothetical protein
MCDVQGTGANFLLAGIYFTFLFSLVIMVLTTAHFLAGAALEKVTANIKEKMFRKFPVIVAVFRIRIGLPQCGSGSSGPGEPNHPCDTDLGPGQTLPSQKIGF